MTWIIGYAATVLGRYVVGIDGCTDFQRITGRAASGLPAGFGEKVWFMPLRANHPFRPALDARFEGGIYRDPTVGANTVAIATPDGVVKPWSIRRRDEIERWDAEAVLAIHLPAVGGEGIPIQVRLPERVEMCSVPPHLSDAEPLVARQVFLKKSDLGGLATSWVGDTQWDAWDAMPYGPGPGLRDIVGSAGPGLKARWESIGP